MLISDTSVYEFEVPIIAFISFVSCLARTISNITISKLIICIQMVSLPICKGIFNILILKTLTP